MCERCVLGTGDNCSISFDAEGVCNYCREFETRWARLPHNEADRTLALEAIVGRIRKFGAGRSYDSILGVSGGIDSTYLACIAGELGLRPLVVHFDNGWNSEIAVQNVENLVTKLGFDLQTYVIDWDDFREMQLAYLRASVIDIEVLTDHAIFGALYKIAMERKIPFILSGANEATEGILPSDWVYQKQDYVNIRSIYRSFGRRPLRTYPFLNYRTKRRIARSGIKIVELLNILPYNKEVAKATIQSELGWRDYGGKHYESVWTRFYQGFILPRKFGVDKRKAHLSTLINSGQVTKEEALRELQSAAYPAELLDKDYAFVLKKLGLSCAEFEELMDLPIRSHRDFETEGSLFHYLPVLKPLRPLWERFKSSTGMDRNRLRMLARR
jgi:N-acetyl sugar amidotransferase